MSSTKPDPKAVEVELLPKGVEVELLPKDVEVELLPKGVAADDEDIPERDVWARKSEYLLSLIGYTVGLGSLWRFPYLCMKNGGGAFLIPFVFFMVICGLPMYYLELALGQFSGKSPMVVWNICPLFKGIGHTMVVLSAMVTWYYATVIAWVLYYLGYSFSSTLPWSTCDNDWNTDRCVVLRGKAPSPSSPPSVGNLSSLYANDSASVSIGNVSGMQTSATEFWRYKVLNISSGVDDWGSIQWPLALTLFLSHAVCFLCIVKGVRSVGKVVWVTALMPYLLLTVILVRSLTLDGATDGIVYYIKPDFNRLTHFQVWYDAALQVFYSLGPAWGGVLTMASFNKFKNKCFSDAVLCVSMDLFTAFYCGFVVFAIVGFLAHESGLKVDEVVETGPGLVFLAYPEALMRLPLPQLWSILFFIMVIFVGLDSQFGMLETVVSGIADLYPNTLRQRKMLVLFCTFIIYFICSLVFSTQAGVYLFMFIDWFASAYCVFLTSLLECVVIGWCYGAERFNRDIQIMTGMSVYPLIRWSWCIFVPIAMSVALIMAVVNTTNPVYNDYRYPDYIGGIGNLISVIPVLPMPTLMTLQIIRADGTLVQRIKHLLKPCRDWLPNDREATNNYKVYEYGHGVWRTIKDNLLGDRRDIHDTL